MYFFPGNANVLRGQVTLNHGANIAGNATQDTTAAVTNAAVGDRVFVSPNANPASGIVVSAATSVTVAGQVSIRIGNITTATVAAGTAVVYNLSIEKNSGNG